MKKFILVLTLLLICSVSFAKEYRVTLDDKYVPYFEKQFEGETCTPEEWLEAQMLNEADKEINRDLLKQAVWSKTRDEKISEIEK